MEAHPKMVCEVCGEEIIPARDYQFLDGFARIKRADGGTNAIHQRRVYERFRCMFHVDTQPENGTQESLL